VRREQIHNYYFRLFSLSGASPLLPAFYADCFSVYIFHYRTKALYNMLIVSV